MLTQLYQSVAEWLIFVSKECDSCFIWHMDNVSECSNILYRSMYLINGNFPHSILSQFQIKLTPIKFKATPMHWITQEQRLTFCNRVLKQLGKDIFRLNKIKINESHTIPSACGNFELMGSLFKYILIESQKPFESSLEAARDLCIGTREW
jgi:hypothetical protein